ncbi:MAG: exonuclease domain-containing protein [Anaerolineae bacterium]|nr:exonuclease domain-containing protein [Anaerolineae bacterium]MDW8171149.1 3'-5' exonuclease [Anaerolineae bacterium]
MTIRKDQILVLDLEATCWEGYKAPVGQLNEIIEVGVCLLNVADLSIAAKRSLLVTPLESEISPFCTALTSITPQMIAQEGQPFEAVCATLERDYDSRNILWASWGAYDHEMFRTQCKRRKQRYPFSKKHVNLKRVFADAKGERMGTERALENLAMSFEGTRHRAHDDAYNAARILARLIQDHGLAILRKYGL